MCEIQLFNCLHYIASFLRLASNTATVCLLAQREDNIRLRQVTLAFLSFWRISPHRGFTNVSVYFLSIVYLSGKYVCYEIGLLLNLC